MGHRFIKALLKQEVDCTPVWVMRQAGRYLPEYRALRQRVPDFMSLCKTPELACEATLQPLARFNLDAAILFSDILTIPDAMGVGLQFVTAEGPKISRPIRTYQDAANLPIIDPETDTAYVMDALRLIRHELADKVPLIGFAGSPWTIATYMIEGGSSKDFFHSKTLLYREPEVLNLLLDKLTASITAYLTAQIHAGAQAVMIFDTWGGALPSHLYSPFSCDHMKKIVQALPRTHAGQEIPVICFSKGVSLSSIDLLADTGCHAVGLDWTVNIHEAKEKLGHKVALQGNLDPGVLYGTPERVQQEVRNILQSVGPGTGHVFNLGHGITPHVDPELVAVLVDSVHEYSKTTTS